MFSLPTGYNLNMYITDQKNDKRIYGFSVNELNFFYDNLL